MLATYFESHFKSHRTVYWSFPAQLTWIKPFIWLLLAHFKEIQQQCHPLFAPTCILTQGINCHFGMILSCKSFWTVHHGQWGSIRWVSSSIDLYIVKQHSCIEERPLPGGCGFSVYTLHHLHKCQSVQSYWLIAPCSFNFHHCPPKLLAPFWYLYFDQMCTGTCLCAAFPQICPCMQPCSQSYTAASCSLVTALVRSIPFFSPPVLCNFFHHSVR